MQFARRTLISAGLLSTTVALTSLSSGAWAHQRYNSQVTAGLQYLRGLAQQNLISCQELLAVLCTGGLEKAKLAYINARFPYKQIEVHTTSFTQIDRAIDARPYDCDRKATNHLRDVSGESRGVLKV